MAPSPRSFALGLAGFQFLDAVACAVPAPAIKADLDRLGCPPELQRALPVIKAAAGLGLLAGLEVPALGKLTGAALVAYFLAAEGFHAKVKDPIAKFVPPAALAALSAHVARTAYS